MTPDFLNQFKRDPSGLVFAHLGEYSALRTMSSNARSSTHVALTPADKELFAFHTVGSGSEEDFRGVDGTKVTSHEALPY